MTWRSAATIALATLFLLGGAGARAGAAPPRPTALDWGGRYFVDDGSFRQWLREHHASYGRWARTHPAARATLGGATGVPAPLSSSDLTTKKGGVSAEGAGVAAPRASPGGATVEVILLVAAMLLLGLAAVPGRAIDARAAAAQLAIRRHRLVLAAAGTSMLAALVLVRLTS
jgi:hypothetical protein